MLARGGVLPTVGRVQFIYTIVFPVWRSMMAEKRHESTHPEAGDLKERLTAEQYQITQEQGTEPAFANRYWDFEGRGVYHCVVCGNELFSSSSKYHSGTGWPSRTPWRPPLSPWADFGVRTPGSGRCMV